jgi:hypothetical protein
MTTNKSIAQMSREELLAYIAKQEAEKLAQAKAKISIKISQRGAVSVYGLGRFPVTLYPSQWEALSQANVMGFCTDNAQAITEAQEAWDALPDDEKARRSAASAPKAKTSARAALVDSLTE